MRLRLFGSGSTEEGHRSSAWTILLKSTLLFTNSLLGIVGFAILCYAAFAYAEFHRAVAPPHKGGVPYPWFIVATAGTGATTVLTALVGLLAGCTAHGMALNLYAVMLVAMLLGQMGFALVVFVDASWRKWPPDPSGEYEKLREWVEHNEELSFWLGIGLLAFQVFAVAVSCALSSTQQQLEEDSSDEDETSWRTVAGGPDTSSSPLLTSPVRLHQSNGGGGGNGSTSSRAGQAAAQQLAGLGQQHDDAWSRRMRDKYGLDTSDFTYVPHASAASSSSQLARSRSGSGRGEEGGQRTWCAVM